MSRTSSFEPLKRAYGNWQRKRNRILPAELPPPFFHAKDIDAVKNYFSEFANEQMGLSELKQGIRGSCFVCKSDVVFRVDVPTDRNPVNWRETLACPHCKFINRWRGCLNAFEVICEPTVDDRIYLTETFSPVYQNLAGRFPLLVSSEYFPDYASGDMVQTHVMPVRNEDVTKLSFADASLDVVLCFDVLEHVPDYRSALKEFHRVLDTGGQLVISVPFSFEQETRIRARLDEAGNIEHLVEPSYHGDPLSDQGVLSYYDFGMELLDEMRVAGFQECFLACYKSKEWVYLGDNVVFLARKLSGGAKKSIIARSVFNNSLYQVRLIGEKSAELFRYTVQFIPWQMHRLVKHYATKGTGEIQAEHGVPDIDPAVFELPDIFHYWSNKYLATGMSRFGFSNPEDFFSHYATAYIKDSRNQQVRILSIGSGHCELEIKIAKKLLQWQLNGFIFECLDDNSELIGHGKVEVEKAGLADHFQFTCDEFNRWKPFRKYGIVLANQSLCNMQNLEGLLGAVKSALKPDGLFIVSENIGRNARMLWPEAMDALQPFWDELPHRYRYNRIMNGQEEQFINHDLTIAGFEARRSQDVLPLLLERFNFKFFFPYGNIIFAFIDRPFGHNFDANADWDKGFVDRVHARDEAGMLSGELKPVSMMAVLTKGKTEMVLRHPALTPENCVRKVPVEDQNGSRGAA